MLIITQEQLNKIINESLLLHEHNELTDDSYHQILSETVSMWIDPETDKRIDDTAEAANMPPGSLAAIYRKGLADWIEHNRYGKGKEQHMHALEDIGDFIHNRHDTRSQYPVEWNRVKNFRIKKKQKEYRHEIEKRKKLRQREEKRKERERRE